MNRIETMYRPHWSVRDYCDLVDGPRHRFVALASGDLNDGGAILRLHHLDTTLTPARARSSRLLVEGQRGEIVVVVFVVNP